MIDYHALKALEAVIELQSFESASKALGISQSAVTQRIQGFEAYLGERLLIRKTPYRASETGESYLNLLRKVTSLENDIFKSNSKKPTLKIAINRDSLDLYFLEVLLDKELAELIALEIIADDQDMTLNFLKSGQVDMCISSQKKPLPNHTATHLGDMVYSLVCAPHFYEKYFKKGVGKESLLNAPLVIFDKNDKAQHTYLMDNYGIDNPLMVNQVPSVRSFKNAILGGFGYGLIPIMDIETEIKKKNIVELVPSKKFKVPLYLHQWEYQRDYVKILNQKILKAASKL